VKRAWPLLNKEEREANIKEPGWRGDPYLRNKRDGER
jgi:hypothetical protein